MRAMERNKRRHRHLSCFPPSTVPCPMMKGWENSLSTPLLGGKAYWKKNKIITCFPYYKWQQIKARCTNSVALRLADFAGDAHWGRSDVLNWLLGRVGPYRVTEAMWLFCITCKSTAGKQEIKRSGTLNRNSEVLKRWIQKWSAWRQKSQQQMTATSSWLVPKNGLLDFHDTTPACSNQPRACISC